ncbi:TPA: hypothetical protein ACGQ2V_005793 [Klebsiella michiganensis]|uniref:hypothetical protein n=1 Tax=Klebsiella michiganensis TaxID=1134687 RepID=UPI002930C8E5|nr:hypothetical protein [Klebsiella michiganensis]
MNRFCFILGLTAISTGCAHRPVVPAPQTQYQVNVPPAFSKEDNEVCNQIEENLIRASASLKQCISLNTQKFRGKTKNTDDIVTAVNYSCDKEITDFSIKIEGRSLCDMARKKGQSFLYTMNYFEGILPGREVQKDSIKKTIRPQIVTIALK